MSRITNRDAAPREGRSVEHRLARWLDDGSALARVVPHLPAEVLHQLIRSRGLDACSGLVTSATPAQLTSLLDLDLWRHARPGADEQFDVDRFGEWLEALVDSGSDVAARTVAALDLDLVVVGLSRYVRVLDPGIFEPTAQSDDEPMDRDEAMREGDAIDLDEAGAARSRPGGAAPMRASSSDGLECEVAGYLVRARRAEAWDAIVALLVALDAEHGPWFHTVMQGCRRLSNSRPEIDGVDDLLRAPEQHLHDVAIQREHRRSQQGYATAADARAFLAMARQPKDTRSGAAATSLTVNPIVAGYFRAAEEASEARAPTPPMPAATSQSTPTESVAAAIELLTEAGMMPQRPRTLLAAADADPQAARLTHLRRLMASVRETDEAACLARSRELAFLANTLLAGCSIQSRPFTPQEASDAAAAICNLGFEYWPARWPGVASSDGSSPCPPDSWLIDHDLVTAFEAGWSVLHDEVSLFAAARLISMLTDLHCVDHDVRHGLVAFRRALVTAHGAGTPWRARDAADVLAMLDLTAWISVLGLLDECPILPAALRAVLDGCRTAVSPTAFDFISTAAQIDDVRRFMRTLPDLLSA